MKYSGNAMKLTDMIKVSNAESPLLALKIARNFRFSGYSTAANIAASERGMRNGRKIKNASKATPRSRANRKYGCVLEAFILDMY